MIAKHAMQLPPWTHSDYPEPFRSRVLPREKRALGDAFGLTHFGVNLTVLPPGRESSMRHWHENEDELVYLLEGELVLSTDRGEETLLPGMVAGFRAGEANGHQFINRGSVPAVYLEVGNRVPPRRDRVHYVGVDLAIDTDAADGPAYTRKDGTPY